MKLNIKKHIHLDVGSTVDEPRFSLFDCDMSEYGYVAIGEQEITIEVPDDFNPIPLQVQAIEKEKKRIQLDCEIKLVALNERIQKLLFIEAPKNQ